MNRRMILNMIGNLVLCEALLLLIPFVVSVIYSEQCAVSFLITIGIALLIGSPLSLICKPHSRVIFAKDGFIIVSGSWIALSVIGALPFFISGEIPYYIDAFFETVSGFTTTGASILTDIEKMSRGLLFWRSFTHWVGGMGVLVFVMAIIPSATDRSMHIIRAEIPGPIVGKLVPKLKETAKILYLIYIVITALEVILLLAGGMPLFDSFIHAFGTAGTGGFGIKSDSIAGYNPYLQWVIATFMIVFGINFNLYYILTIGKIRTFLKSQELLTYLAITFVSIVIVTLNILPLYESFSEAIRASAFQVSSIITTTGYSTADFNVWPSLSKGILFCLMLIGSCAGSTAGGFKISRFIIMIKMMKCNLQKMLHPRSVSAVKFEGKKIDDATLFGTTNYLSLYLICFFIIFLILSIGPYDFETNISATAACFNNIGPGFGAVGPAASFAGYSGFHKIVLSVAMLLGRLEIYPILLIMSPSTWSKK